MDCTSLLFWTGAITAKVAMLGDTPIIVTIVTILSEAVKYKMVQI
jgi:hypothetical protein